MAQIALAPGRLPFYEPSVQWNVILFGLAVLSAVLGLWQWIAALRFPLHKRASATSTCPGLTLLKPLKGCDSLTETCLRSWLKQDYHGPAQFLFGVASAEDPVCDVVRALLAECPEVDGHLAVCPEVIGANAKVSTLAQLQPKARHDILVVSDADVSVELDFLTQLVQPLAGAGAETNEDEGRGRGTKTISGTLADVGLVSCFYRLANPSTLAMRWEAVAVNADFWSQVLQSNSMKPMDFALGAVMACRREALEAIGGFEALADCLADDYQLGHRIVKAGWRAELCPVVVECWDPPQGWGAVWAHQLRWARTVRVCQPVPYFFSILNNATLWALLWGVAGNSAVSWGVAAVLVALRIVLAGHLQWRLTCNGSHVGWFWMIPVRDLLGALIWAGAFLGNTITWRERRMRLRPDGTLQMRIDLRAASPRQDGKSGVRGRG